MKKIILWLALVLLLSGCGSGIENRALNKSKDYILSMKDGDFKRHFKLLESFRLDRNEYRKSFYDHILDAKVLDAQVAYKDDYVVIVALTFELELDESFEANSRLQKGRHTYTRYLTYKILKSMALEEILDQLIR